MFEQLLRTEDIGEIWDTFYPTDDQWPAEGDLEGYKVLQHLLHCSGTQECSSLVIAWPMHDGTTSAIHACRA